MKLKTFINDLEKKGIPKNDKLQGSSLNLGLAFPRLAYVFSVRKNKIYYQIDGKGRIYNTSINNIEVIKRKGYTLGSVLKKIKS